MPLPLGEVRESLRCFILDNYATLYDTRVRNEGIEPSPSIWKIDVLPKHLSRVRRTGLEPVARYL